jgi:hypothetical protein
MRSSHSDRRTDEEAAELRELLERISVDALAGIATKVRGTPFRSCSVLNAKEPLCGSYNVVFLLEFSDGLKWAARIPYHGPRCDRWQEASEALTTQGRLLNELAINTTIPVPRVYHCDTMVSNEVGAPFMLMSWIPGISVQQLWFDTNGPTTLQERRSRILQGLAAAMLQLRKWSFPNIGKILVEDHQTLDNVAWQTLTVVRGWLTDLQRFQIGPFTNAQDYYHYALDTSWGTRAKREVEWEESGELGNLDNHVHGQQVALHLMIDAIPRSHREGFVLVHPDLAKHNVKASEDGTITGILDWDGVRTMPRNCGYTRYPGWIIQDFNPRDYRMFDPTKNPYSSEDSPAAMSALRQEYNQCIAELSAEDAADNKNSHVIEAIELASSDQMSGVLIVEDLMERCFRDMPFDADYVWDTGLEGDEESHEKDHSGDEGSSLSSTHDNNIARRDIPDTESVEEVRSILWSNFLDRYLYWSASNPLVACYLSLQSLVKRVSCIPGTLIALAACVPRREFVSGTEKRSADSNIDEASQHIHKSQVDVNLHAHTATDAFPYANTVCSPTADRISGSSAPDEIEDQRSRSVSSYASSFEDHEYDVSSWNMAIYEGLAQNALREEHLELIKSRFKDMFNPKEIFN